MARKALTVRASGFKPLFPLLRKRALDLRPVAEEIIDHLRFGGTGSVEDHFRSQGHYTPGGGFERWKPSQRALRVGGLTLVDTGAYRAAWLGKGVGGRTRREKNRVRVFVDSTRFPQVNVFQADAPVRTGRGHKALVAPRPISVNPKIMEGVVPIVLNYIATGKGRAAARGAA